MKSRRGAYSLSRRLISAWLQSHADTHLQAIVFTIFIGLILSSAFSALVVYAQEIEPGRAGRVTGLMFGVNGLAAAGPGKMADIYGIEWVYGLCAFLPLLGCLCRIKSAADNTL
ncbi:hypothetical protein BFS13_13570 [Pantoea sp. Ae16]|nr:hypothetical protein BFS13_13570 [Pantoea sp. Ae16]